MSMKTISISQLKSGLSAALRSVRRGTEVVVTDRGHPVARLVPVRPVTGDVDALVEAGLIQLGTRKLPGDFLDRVRVADVDGDLVAAVQNEREGGY